MKVIMIVTNKYDPDIRVHKEATYLIKKGYDVEVLCWDRENEYKNNEIEIRDGVVIKRFFPFSKYGTGMKQFKSYIKFMQLVKEYLKDKSYEFVHCHDLDGIIVGKFSKNNQSILIFDMHEIYELQTKNTLKRVVIKKAVSYYVKKSDYIIYLNEFQKNKSTNLNNNWIYLPNYPNMSNSNNYSKIPSESLRISYIGTVRQYDEIKVLAEAAKGLNDITIYIHGRGVDFDRVKLLESEFDNLIVTGAFDYSELIFLYSQADISYIVYSSNNEQHMISYPVKLYESIVTLTPIIVNKGSILEKYVNEFDIGFSVDSSSVSDVRNLLLKILSMKNILETKHRSLKNISEKYKWQNVVRNLDKIY